MQSLLIEFIKFLLYSSIIVVISKYILVTTLRKLAENLSLKSKTIGSIAGYATSVPELLTIVISSFNGLIATSIYNILSSNVINLVQYIASILINKNIKSLKNNAIKLDMILIATTILIPFLLLAFNIDLNINLIPIFIITYALFVYINSNTHKIYLKEENLEEERNRKKNYKKVITYSFQLIITGVILFLIGDRLGIVLENLCKDFNISEGVIGILLGFITSLPELITFFEAQKYYKYSNKQKILGVVEATNNLFTSNILNLFIIQSIGILMYTML